MTKLVFLGDYCNTSNCQPALGAALQQCLGNADAVLADLEAPVAVPPGTLPVLKVGPNLQQPLAALDNCRSWGVTHFSMANNHIMDFGAPGLQATLQALAGFTYFGAGMTADAAYRPAFIETAHGRIGLLAFAEAQFGVIDDAEAEDQAGFAWFDHPRTRALIVETRRQCDVLIVQVHAGLEFVGIPLPELRARYREFVDLGADLIVGHHPHVFQGSECYRGKWIHYSLGNFLLDIMLDDPAASGALLQVSYDDKGLQSSLHPLCYAAGTLDLASSDSPLQARYQERCRLLSASDYRERIDAACLEKWQACYEDYYLQALNGLGGRPSLAGAKRFGKRVLKRGLRLRDERARENQVLLLHNIRIETHRWVVQRVLAKERYPA